MNVKIDFILTAPSTPNFVAAHKGDTSIRIDVADLTDDQVEALIVTMAQKLRENVKERRFARIGPVVGKVVLPEERW